MASFAKVNGKWKVYVARKGVRKSATFETKREAVEWATRTEALILSNKQTSIPNIPFSDLLNRYIDTVTVRKKGERWERNRLLAIARMPIGSVMLPDFDERHVAQWRDERLDKVSSDTVAREWTILNHACKVAVKEWKWLDHNPFAELKRPKESKPRERRISQDEIERIVYACGFDEDKPVTTSTAKVAVAFLFAIETAMRMGEITGLTWDRVNLDERTAFLPDTKNGTSRTVPLSSRAVELLNKLPKESDLCFNMTSQSLEALFRKCKARVMIEDLHFHDTRHEAITRLSKKLDVLELARTVGHRDLRSLMIYYNPTAAELAKKLD